MDEHQDGGALGSWSQCFSHKFLQFFLVVSFRYFPWHNCYNNNTTDISNYFDCYDYDSYQVQDHDQD
jgi:hypothetical protein